MVVRLTRDALAVAIWVGLTLTVGARGVAGVAAEVHERPPVDEPATAAAVDAGRAPSSQGDRAAELEPDAAMLAELELIESMELIDRFWFIVELFGPPPPPPPPPKPKPKPKPKPAAPQRAPDPSGGPPALPDPEPEGREDAKPSHAPRVVPGGGDAQ